MNLILGMHRSGTSLIARLCYLAGADLGDPRTFHRGDRWNPDGYFEQPEIHAVNIPLVNGPWGRLSYLWLPSTRTILHRAQRLAQQLRRAIELYGNRTVKDPRFCLTLPAWLASGARVERAIVCLRSPQAVADSLWRRNRLPAWYSFGLWRRHIEAFLKNFAGVPSWFIRYENLMARDCFTSELLPAMRALGVRTDEQQLQALFARAIRTTPTNQRPVIEKQLPPRIDRLYAELLRRHAAQVRVTPTSDSQRGAAA